MECWEYQVQVGEAMKENPSWRRGQAAFNVLAEVRPDLSSQIRGSLLDPFYSDGDLDMADFYTWVEENW